MGWMSLFCALPMWATSVNWVRRKYYSLFKLAHWLFIGVLVFGVMHVGAPFCLEICASCLPARQLNEWRFCRSVWRVLLAAHQAQICVITEDPLTSESVWVRERFASLPHQEIYVSYFRCR